MAKRARAKVRSRTRGKALALELQQTLRDPVSLSAAGLVVLSLVDSYIWIGALVSELAFLLVFLCIVLAIAFAVRKQRVRAGVLVACAVFFMSASLPYVRSTRPTPQHGPTLRIAQAHAAFAQLSAARFASWLAQSRVDVVSLTGLRESDARALRIETSAYDRIADPENGAQLMWIRRTLHVPSRPSHPSSVRLGGCQVELVQVDLPSIFAPSRLGDRRRTIALLAQNPPGPRGVSISVGHLGSSSAAADLAPIHASRELRDVRLGHGRLATAPAVLGPLGLPVDHILLRGWILTRSADIEAPLVPGMHRTLLATLELTEPRCARREPSRP